MNYSNKPTSNKPAGAYKDTRGDRNTPGGRASLSSVLLVQLHQRSASSLHR